MWTETALSIGLGIVLKAYDDIIDMHVSAPEVVTELLKALTVCFFVLLAKDDFSFALITFIALLGNSFVGGVDMPFWQAFTQVAAFMTGMTLHWEGDIIRRILLGVLVPAGVIVEPLLFPEESSTSKTWTRIGLGALLILVQCIPFFQIPFFSKLCTFAISYFATSATMTYLFGGETDQVTEAKEAAWEQLVRWVSMPFFPCSI